ncbi:MAG: UDP-2,3-diacylglucosamine diphosphatase, partial [Syntrophothermus sp.]
MDKKIYFASDFHFGIPDRDSSLKREKRFIDWLDMVSGDASAIYLMGDLFDFWFEYKKAVPRGYVRLLGKLAELADAGIAMHLFRGNHDMWAFDYLEKEIGFQLHRDPEIRQLGNKIFYLAHGDGLGPGDHGYKLIKKIFQMPFNQWLFRQLHPDVGIRMGLYWSGKSRYANELKENGLHEDTEIVNSRLIVHSRTVLEKHPEINYFVYGHWHVPLDIPLNENSHQISLGDWL